MADLKQLLLMAGGGVILAVVAGLPAFAILRRMRATANSPVPDDEFTVPMRPASMWPAPAPWVVPWNGASITLAFIFSFLFTNALAPLILTETGIFGWLYGPDFPTRLNPDDLKDPTRRQDAHLIALWSMAIGLPMAIAAITLGLMLTTDARPRQMGWTRDRIGPNLALGYFGWLLLTPLVFAIFMIASLFATPEQHPLTDLGVHAGAREMLLFAFQVAILAPISEELLFRGLLLPWLAQPPSLETRDPHALVQPTHRAHIVMAIALLFPATGPIGELLGGQWDHMSLPPTFLFIALLLPFYLVLPTVSSIRRAAALPSVQAGRAIFASSALFAAVHSSVWPSPVPLFFLGIGLAWLALRTRSIVPTVTVHSLFNSVAVIYLCMPGAK